MTNIGKAVLFALCLLILAILAILDHDMRQSLKALEPKQQHELITRIDGLGIYADGFGGYFVE